MNVFKIEDFLRDEAASIQIDQISFAKLCQLTKADGIQPSQSTRFGNRLFLTNGGERVQVNGKNFSAIRLGKSVVLTNDLFDEAEGMEALKELVNNHVVYYGQTEGDDPRTWIAFGKKGELVPGKVYSLKALMKAYTGTI